MTDLWIIERRHSDGLLDLAGPQPETFFGRGAIVGMGDNAIAQAIFRERPDAILTGDRIELWPTLIDPYWHARRKTW